MLSIALSAALQSLQPLPSEVYEFGSWVVACDNGRRCQAIAVGPDDTPEAEYRPLIVEREPEAASPLRFILAEMEGSPARLVVGDEAVPAAISPTDGAGAREIRFSDPGLALRTLAYADALQVQSADAVLLGTVPLAGLQNALLYMDEVQGRRGGVTAAIRRGPRAATEVPPPPALPAVRVRAARSAPALTIPASRITELRREVDCEIGNVGGPDEAEVHMLRDGQALVLLACGTGAYNLTSIAFLAERQGGAIAIRPAPFDTALEDWESDQGPHHRLINADWAGEQGLLSDFSRGRGIGDCGTRSTYGWDGDGFRLVHREEMPVCRGSITYVTTWRAEIVRP